MRKPNMTKKFQIHQSISKIAHLYDGFILDQYGVLHDGTTSLPFTNECIETLYNLNKKLIILSNTSSPSSYTINRLPKLGFNADHFIGAVTSGDEAAKYIKEHFSGKKALLFTWKKGKSTSPVGEFLHNCGDIKIASSIDDADFIILHGCQVIQYSNVEQSDDNITSIESFHDGGIMDDVNKMLQECYERKLPMICANPDFITIYKDGSVRHMPGKIAKAYESLNTTQQSLVTYFGKPHAAHFEACVAKLNIPKNRVVHVGDSLHHDIKGAVDCGVDCIFIASGVHAKELDCGIDKVVAASGRNSDEKVCDGEDYICGKENVLDELFTKEGGIVPTHVLPFLNY